MGFKKLCSASNGGYRAQIYVTHTSQKMKLLISFMQTQTSI